MSGADWVEAYGKARLNDRATRWSGGVGEKFPMQPEKLHPTTVPTLQTSQFGPSREGLVLRGNDADVERYDYNANPGNRMAKRGLDRWDEDIQANRPTLDSRMRVEEGNLTAREYSADLDRKVRVGNSARDLHEMAIRDYEGEGAPDSFLNQTNQAASRLREFSQFDQSSPPPMNGSQFDAEIVTSIVMGREGMQHGGARGASELLRTTSREIRSNPLRHGRN